MAIFSPRHRRATSREALYWLTVLAALLLILAPTALMLLASVQTQDAIFSNPLHIPSPLHWENYSRAWDTGGIVDRAGNSAVVAGPASASAP